MTISWREICGAIPHWSLAGSSATPPSGTLAQQRGSGVAAFIQFASTYLNQQSVNRQIYQQLQQEAESHDLESRLSGDSSGRGVYGMATYIQHRHPDGQYSGSNVSVNVYRGTYSSPEDVVSSIRETGTIRAEASTAGTRLVHRYFWGVRLDEFEPRYIGGDMRGPGAHRRSAARARGPRIKPF